MPISTCLSNGRPANALHGDMLYETDTMRLIVYDTSLGGGSERWVYHSASGYQFPSLMTATDMLNYGDLKTTPNTSSPYYLSVSPDYHLDARFIDGVDSANNPAHGTPLAEIVNRSSKLGVKFTQDSASGPQYRIINSRRVISGKDLNAPFFQTWESDGTTGWLNSQSPNADWTYVHISQRDLNTDKILSFPSYNNPSQGMVGYVYNDATDVNLGWPSQGITNLRHRFFSHQARATDANGNMEFWAWTAPRAGAPVGELNKGLFQTDPNLTDPQKGALLKNLFDGYGDNTPQLWILQTGADSSGNRVASWYMNGNHALSEAPQSAATPELASGLPYAYHGNFYIKGSVMETMFFSSTLSAADKNKILDYAVTTYGVGSTTLTTQF